MPLPAACLNLTRRRWLHAAGALPLALHLQPACAAEDVKAGAIDLMPDFWRAYDASVRESASARAAHLRRAFFGPHEATYRLAGIKPPDEPAIARWLVRFDAIAADTRALHARLERELGRHRADFRAALPDFDPQRSPVHLMPSMDRFDAHLEPHPDGLPLFFAPDGIVRYHGAGADLSVLFSHEMFHCYQGQLNAGMAQDAQPAVYVNLWIEGGATYASEHLNPGASLRHVLLDDEVLLRDGPRVAPRVAAAMLDRIDATDDATLNSFFSMGATAEWPARAGYYVGLLAARDWARTMSLQQLAAMPREQVRQCSLDALRRIAGQG
ncbi:MAG: hypothetical protein EOP35_05060 [Rubrivivax sp.]|nr:MAG: hypothetical protein EOP35_05060 [Rubrivivax sp.]